MWKAFFRRVGLHTLLGWVNDTGLVLKLGIPWVGLPEQACSSKRKKKKKQNKSGDGREERI